MKQDEQEHCSGYWVVWASDCLAILTTESLDSTNKFHPSISPSTCLIEAWIDWLMNGWTDGPVYRQIGEGWMDEGWRRRVFDIFDLPSRNNQQSPGAGRARPKYVCASVWCVCRGVFWRYANTSSQQEGDQRLSSISLSLSSSRSTSLSHTSHPISCLFHTGLKTPVIALLDFLDIFTCFFLDGAKQDENYGKR